MPPVRFVVFIGVSLAAFILVLNWALRRRAIQPSRWRIAGVSAFVVIVGMVFAKFGANAGLSPSIYYELPALATLALPPVAFRMTGVEYAQYAILAFATSPIIHVLFSLAGWHEYLPFWHVPSIAELRAPAALVDWTDGCIAVTNREIEEIWRVVPDSTPIFIEP